MDGLGLAEPVAVTLVRRGYRTVDAARGVPRGRRRSRSVRVRRDGRGVRADPRRGRGGAADHRPRRLRRRRRVLDRDRWSRALRALGGECDWLIPGRQDDGYGLTAATVERLAARGTVAADHRRLRDRLGRRGRGRAGSRDRGDRHRPPPAGRASCPTARSCIRRSAATRSRELCATGVAYKLARRRCAAPTPVARRARPGRPGDGRRPGRRCEARTGRWCARGLAVARQARRPGLRALIASAGVAPERLDEGDFAFRLGPRINAAGRLYRADAGVELMLTADEARASEIAAELERANHERRAVEREVLDAAEAAPRDAPRRARATPPASCSRARAGTRASSASSPRGWSSATAARPC